jgi:hypothetical protein
MPYSATVAMAYPIAPLISTGPADSVHATAASVRGDHKITQLRHVVATNRFCGVAALGLKVGKPPNERTLFATGLAQNRSRQALVSLNCRTLSRQVQPTCPQNSFDLQMTPGLWKTIQTSAAKTVSQHGAPIPSANCHHADEIDPRGPRMNRSGALGATGQDVAEH